MPVASGDEVLRCAQDADKKISPRFPQDERAIVRRGHRRFHPSQSQVRLFAHGRCEQGRNGRGARQGERHAGGRRHRPQQPLRRPGVRPVCVKGRHSADHRLRSRHPPRGRGRHRHGGQGPAGRLARPAGPERDRLPQPDAAGEPRPSRVQDRLAAGAAPVRAGRQYRGPAGPGRQHGQRRRPPAGGGSGAGRDPPARTSESAVRRPALYRAAAPWRGGRAAHRGSAARSRLFKRPAAGGDQRRAFPQGLDVRGARRAAVHRAGRPYRGSQPPPADAGALFQVGRPDARALRRPAGGLRQYPGDRPALRLHAGAAQADPAALHQARRPRREGCAEGNGRERPRRAEKRRPAGARHRRSRRTRTGSPTSST